MCKFGPSDFFKFSQKPGGVLDQKGLGQKGLEKSHVNVNVVIGHVVVLIARIVEQSTLVQIVKMFHKTCKVNINEY